MFEKQINKEAEKRLRTKFMKLYENLDQSNSNSNKIDVEELNKQFKSHNIGRNNHVRIRDLYRVMRDAFIQTQLEREIKIIENEMFDNINNLKDKNDK